MSSRKDKMFLYVIAVLALVILLICTLCATYVGVYTHSSDRMPFLFGKTLYAYDGMDASIDRGAAILTDEELFELDVGDGIVIPSELGSGFRAAVGYVSDLSRENLIGYVGADGNYLRYIETGKVYGKFLRPVPIIGGIVEFAASTFGMIAFGLLSFIAIVLIAICIAKILRRPVTDAEAENALFFETQYPLNDIEREEMRRQAVYPDLEKERELTEASEPQKSSGQRKSKQIKAVSFGTNEEWLHDKNLDGGLDKILNQEEKPADDRAETVSQLIKQARANTAEFAYEAGEEAPIGPGTEDSVAEGDPFADLEDDDTAYVFASPFADEEPAAREKVEAVAEEQELPALEKEEELALEASPIAEESAPIDSAEVSFQVEAEPSGAKPKAEQKRHNDIVTMPPLGAVIEESGGEEEAKRRPDVNGMFLDDTAEMVVEGTDSQMEKLAELIDKTIKRRGNDSVVMDLFYEENNQTRLKIKCGWKDVALVSTIIATLMERSREKSFSEGKNV